MKLSYEAVVVTSLNEEVLEPVYQDLTEEERQDYRDEGFYLVPKRLKIGEKPSSVVVRKNAEYRRLFSNILDLDAYQYFQKKRVSKKYFVISNGQQEFLIKGSYEQFVKMVEQSQEATKIQGFSKKI